MSRNSETLRTALFQQIEGLQAGTVKPETAKATAACAMAICKTVDLDLRAMDQLKDGKGMNSLPLTSEQEVIEGDINPIQGVVESDEDLDDSARALIAKILKGHQNGLPPSTIAERLRCSSNYVSTIIAKQDER